MRSDDLDYPLPADRIATTPASPRDHARLMLARRGGHKVEHHRVHELPALLQAGDLLVFNETRVLPAYLEGRRAATGGKVTGLFLSETAGDWHVMLESRGKLTAGERIVLDDAAELELAESEGAGQWRARLHADTDTPSVLARIGRTPLPPYIRQARRSLGQTEINDADATSYNTVYANRPGSVAAPTAGLHFTDELLAALDQAGIVRACLTLHVGLGTFAPVRTDNLEDHAMHSEWFTVPGQTLAAIRAARSRGSRVIPVGTTTVRALESLPQTLPEAGPCTATTDLFIRPASEADPAFAFRFTDALLTNFHLPRSTLLALVAALPQVGVDRLLHWYRQAVDQNYRFYSYGDAMLIV